MSLFQGALFESTKPLKQSSANHSEKGKSAFSAMRRISNHLQIELTEQGKKAIKGKDKN